MIAKGFVICCGVKIQYYEGNQIGFFEYLTIIDRGKDIRKVKMKYNI